MGRGRRRRGGCDGFWYVLFALLDSPYGRGLIVWCRACSLLSMFICILAAAVFIHCFTPETARHDPASIVKVWQTTVTLCALVLSRSGIQFLLGWATMRSAIGSSSTSTSSNAHESIEFATINSDPHHSPSHCLSDTKQLWPHLSRHRVPPNPTASFPPFKRAS